MNAIRRIDRALARGELALRTDDAAAALDALEEAERILADEDARRRAEVLRELEGKARRGRAA